MTDTKKTLEISEEMPSYTEILENLEDCFIQACNTKDGYDHMCISTYESTQKTLIAAGIIKSKDCYRH